MGAGRELVSLVSARLLPRHSIGAPHRVVMIGLFADGHAPAMRAHRGPARPGVTVEPLTLDELRASEPVRCARHSADLVVTFVNRSAR